jgi:hypothetical protein
MYLTIDNRMMTIIQIKNKIKKINGLINLLIHNIAYLYNKSNLFLELSNYIPRGGKRKSNKRKMNKNNPFNKRDEKD